MLYFHSSPHFRFSETYYSGLAFLQRSPDFKLIIDAIQSIVIILKWRRKRQQHSIDRWSF